MANFSSTYPSTRPVFNADFSNAGRLDSRITFSRSDTPPTYAAPSAVHYWSNEKHLSSENLWKHSDDLSHADNPINDNVDNLTVTGGQTGPTSSITTAVELKPNTTNTFHRAYTDSGVVASSGQLTISLYAKASGYKNLTIFVNGPDDGAMFDLSAATVTNDATYPPASTSITQVGSTGWYRCTLTTNSYSGSNIQIQLQVRNDSGDFSYAGDGTSAILVYGGQINTGANALDYQSTTTQIHREYAPTLKSVSTAGQPRFEYSPTDSASAAMGESLGLLVEGQSQNLITYSNDSTQWSSVNVNMTAASGIAPSGSLEANLCVPSAATDYHWFYVNSPSFTSGTVYTQSVYVKSAGANYIQLSYSGSAFPIVHCNFDLANGTVGSSSGMTGAIQSVGNGWYRISGTVTATSSATAIPFISHITSSTSGRRPSTVGDGYSGYLVYGYQVEANSFASSYISSNSGSATTRASDSASAVTADIGYTGGPVSLVGEASMKSPSSNVGSQTVVTLGSENDNRLMLYNNGSKADTLFLSSDGSSTAFLTGTITNSDFFKFAVRVDTNSVGRSVNGGAVSTDTSTQISNKLDSLRIGNGVYNGQEINGHIKRIALYGEALSDTNLQALTS